MSSSLLNQRIHAAFEQIKRIPYFSGAHGDSIDGTLFNKLNEHIKGKKVSPNSWVESEAYTPFRRLCLQKIFRFDVEVPELLIVDKPNGSQNWPDALVLFGFKGMPIEFKSTKADKIVWNSGLPQSEGIYVFNGRAQGLEQQTTFFLGSAILSEEERSILRSGADQNHEAVQSVNAELSEMDSMWSLYPRPMFNCTERYLSSPRKRDREEDVLKFIDTFVWERATPEPPALLPALDQM